MSRLRCPACHSSKLDPMEILGSVTESLDEVRSLTCPTCGWHSQSTDGVHWIFRNPSLRRLQWKERLQIHREGETHLLENVTQKRTQLSQELSLPTTQVLQEKAPTSPSLLRKKAALDRLDGEIKASHAELAYLDQLTAFLTHPSDSAQGLPHLSAKAYYSENTAEGHLLRPSELTSFTQTLDSYRTQIFRDWGWPSTQENTILREAFLEALRQAPPPSRSDLGHGLLLGSGPGRLLWEFAHHSWPTDLGIKGFVGFDINPSLLFITQSMFRSQELSLAERLKAPPHAEVLAPVTILKTPKVDQRPPLPTRLFCGDWFENPFGDHSWGWVLSPWFFDILPMSPDKAIGQLSRLLRPGGLWLFAGSTAFHHGPIEEHWTRREWLYSVEEQGFEIHFTKEVETPFLSSPRTSQKRFENMLVFAAVKKGSPLALEEVTPWPDWLRDYNRPIPQSDFFRQKTHQHKLLAATLSLIDGQRSIDHLASMIAQGAGITKAESLSAIVQFFQAILESRSINSKSHSL